MKFLESSRQIHGNWGCEVTCDSNKFRFFWKSVPRLTLIPSELSTLWSPGDHGVRARGLGSMGITMEYSSAFAYSWTCLHAPPLLQEEDADMQMLCKVQVGLCRSDALCITLPHLHIHVLICIDPAPRSEPASLWFPLHMQMRLMNIRGWSALTRGTDT